jgi:SP family sugar:H+ symporter-like MFS transporter
MWAGAKILAGFGIGAIQSTLPVYITEWAPNNIRGAMIICYGIWNNIGGFIAPVVLTAMEKTDPYNWRTPMLTQFAFLGIMAPIFIYLPETASYFAARGEHDKGRATLQRVNGNVEGYDVDQEYAIILNTIEEERRSREYLDYNPNSVREILTSYIACFRGTNLKRTFAASLPLVLQQVCGLSFLNTYSSFFFRQAGFANPFDITAILTGIKIASIGLLVILADKVGRRPLVLFGAFWTTAMLFIVGIAGQFVGSTSIQNLTIAAACLWSGGSSALGIIGWTFVGEVSSQKLRARTAGLAAGISVLFGLTFNSSVPVMRKSPSHHLLISALLLK